MKPSVKSPVRGSDDAVRSMKRSLRRRQCNPLLVGIRECRAPSIRAKAMEGTEDLEVQVPKDSSAYGARNVSRVAAGTGEALPGSVTCGECHRKRRAL